MARRQVKCTTKNRQGEVTHVGGTDNLGIRFFEIESTAVNHIHTYYTYVDGHLAEVIVVTINGNKHLHTKKDGTAKNNLGELTNC